MNFSTFSLVARDPETGNIAVAGGTNWFNYGRWVPHVEAGVGALATQAETNMWYAPHGMEDLRNELSAKKTVEDMLVKDPDRNGVYQLLVLDIGGHAYCYTGEHCHDFAGSICEKNIGVAGNTLVSKATLEAVVDFMKKSKLPFPLKIIKALQEGQRAGGDIRGMKSAALKVVKGISSGKYWKDTLYDLRVDENINPLKELERLYQVAEAYNKIGLAEDSKTSDEALVHYLEALKLDPGNAEIMFWIARIYHKNGKVKDAEELRTKLKSSPGKWDEYWKRLNH